ncbi:cytochrome c oxidase-assembly factor COX23, mitochondrial isoform X1 [Manihot esculenta]|uniref:cytochrome c oxidase-assembly factor COX23, mitochondrial isoform X1 n=1 Tax=Manihot esculenta TaxID=3983 RepID=UPI000B5D3A08|nr:cytochrome c oxidase-assembly factor COX23, mitochondrial isoform X1 [Manihot esculenta]
MGSKAATPPYPSAARIADSQCYPQYTASLKSKFAGLEEFSSDKSKCQEHFDVYKECKKKEREARLERNKSRSFFS